MGCTFPLEKAVLLWVTDSYEPEVLKFKYVNDGFVSNNTVFWFTRCY